MSNRREASYVEFVTARQTHFRRMAYAICGNDSQAEDLLQIALVKLYIAWPRIHRNGAEEAYVRRIIVRSHIDDLRKASNRETPGLEGFDHAAAPQPGPEEQDALFSALQQLPLMQRKVVLLRHWLGMSVAETAAELSISAGTVKSHSSRGLEKLQGMLERT